MFAKFDEIPALPVQDIKEKPICTIMHKQNPLRITKGNNSNRITYFLIINFILWIFQQAVIRVDWPAYARSIHKQKLWYELIGTS